MVWKHVNHLYQEGAKLNRSLDRSRIWLPYVLGTMISSYILGWGIVIGNQFGMLQFGSIPMMTMWLLYANTPPIIAIFLILSSKQRTFKELLKELFALKQPLRYYAIAILLPILSSVIPLFQGQASIIAPLYLPLVMWPMNAFFGGLEEVGWRYIFQPALEQKMSFTLATIITGAIWAVWHLPLFFVEGVNQYTMNFWSFAIWVMGLAFALAVLYRLSKSIWLCILFHSLINAITDSISPEFTDIQSSIVGAIIMIAVSLSLLKLLPEQKNLNS